MLLYQKANPKGFLKTILVQIKPLWLKLCHPEAEIVKPLGFLTLLNSYVNNFNIGQPGIQSIYGKVSTTHCNGSTAMPPRRISQCRCGPVTRPVSPI